MLLGVVSLLDLQPTSEEMAADACIFALLHLRTIGTANTKSKGYLFRWQKSNFEGSREVSDPAALRIPK